MLLLRFPFTPRAKRVLELSLEEARQLGFGWIGRLVLRVGTSRDDINMVAVNGLFIDDAFREHC